MVDLRSAYVLINAEIGSERRLIEELKDIDGVKDARIVFGEFDIVAEVCCDTRRELKDSVSMKVRRLDNIISTSTLMAI